MNIILHRFHCSKRFFSLFLFICTFAAASASAEVPQLLNYQGRLTDDAGTPRNGDIAIVFRIYDAVEGGSALWGEEQTVTVVNGVFNVLLGSGSPIQDETATPRPELRQVFGGSRRWLAVKIGSDPEMTPRQEIVSVAYSMEAEHSSTSDDGVPVGAVLIFTGTECPEGYGRLSELDNRFLRGGSRYGDTGGAAVVGKILSESTSEFTGVNHGHSFTGVTGKNSEKFWGDNSHGPDGYASSEHPHAFGGTTTEAGGEEMKHSHTVGLDFQVDTIPPYTTILFCKKD